LSSTDWIPGTGVLVRAAMALGPVLLFLLALHLLDSYKLVRPRRILLGLIGGGAMGLVGYLVNSTLLELTGMDHLPFAYGIAPVVEEILKASLVFWFLKSGRAGFLVDAAILGFAVGAGFSLLENLYYLSRIPDAPLIVWAIRGFGTALMHGGCTAIFAVAARSLARRWSGSLLRAAWPGLMIAALLHAGFNRAMIQPIITTLILLLVLPATFWFVYRRGEKYLREWVGRGFDRDQELLTLIKEGRVVDSPLGRYLISLKASFRSDTVADMLCLLRLQAELSIIAKGSLLLRQHGFPDKPGQNKNQELLEKLAEVRWLEQSVGRAGLLALRPVSHCSDRRRWQRHFLREGAAATGSGPGSRGADPS
jgi:protease PrsW